MQCEGLQAVQREAESQGFCVGNGARCGEEHMAHQQIVYLPGDAAVKALVAIVIPSLLEPLGRRGSEEGNQ